MAASTVVDAGFVVALLSKKDRHHPWAIMQSSQNQLPWVTCDAVLSEAFHLLGSNGRSSLTALLRRAAVVSSFNFAVPLAIDCQNLIRAMDIAIHLSYSAHPDATKTL